MAGAKQEIVQSLQQYTDRDLSNHPPQDTEKVGDDLGVSKTNLDRFIRPWINKRFRVPAGKSRLPPGTIKSDTTFKALCDYALVGAA